MGEKPKEVNAAQKNQESVDPGDGSETVEQVHAYVKKLE